MLIKYKILYTIPNFDTAGSGKALFNIAKSLDDDIFEPHVCISHTKGSFFQIVKDSNVKIHIHKTTHEMIPRLKGLNSCWKLSRYFKSLDIDLIHSFHYGSDYSEALSARYAGIPWIFTKKNMNWGNRSKNSWKLRSFLSSRIIVQNNEMISTFYPNNKKVSLIPRGVDVNEFSKVGHRGIREKYKIPKNKKIIIAVANLVPVKGIHILIDAFELICQKDNSYYLLIVGEKNTPYGKEMEDKAFHSNYKSSIRLIGKVLDVKPFLSISSLFVLPTLNNNRKEGSPVSLLEAMSLGINVIASKIAGVEDILSNFPENMFVPGDKKLLQKAIIEQFKNSKSNKGNNFKSHIKNHFSLIREVSSHQKVYKNCLNI